MTEAPTRGPDDVHARAHAHPHAARESALANRRRLLLVLVGGLVVMAAEIAGGLLANSLVLLADAAHYAVDALGIGVAFFAASLALRPATEEKSFGYERAEVVASFVNAAALWGLSAFFIWESYRRLLAPPPVQGTLVLAIGAISLVANVLLTVALAGGRGASLNVRAVYLHLLGDVAGSIAALAAGILLAVFGWRYADAALTLVITLILLVFTWRLTRETLNILLQGTPRDLDVAAVERAIRTVAPVKELHELHVWSLTPGRDVLSVHVVLDAPPTGDQVTHDIHEALSEAFHIDHVTVQVESPDCPCESARC
ncbi:MAG: cation diffusion facilitator family transporter [Thermoplasmatota archaeon]